MNNRIKELRKQLRLTQQQFAERIGSVHIRSVLGRKRRHQRDDAPQCGDGGTVPVLRRPARPVPLGRDHHGRTVARLLPRIRCEIFVYFVHSSHSRCKHFRGAENCQQPHTAGRNGCVHCGCGRGGALGHCGNEAVAVHFAQVQFPHFLVLLSGGGFDRRDLRIRAEKTDTN